MNHGVSLEALSVADLTAGGMRHAHTRELFDASSGDTQRLDLPLPAAGA